MREVGDFFSAPPVLVHDEPQGPETQPDLPRPQSVPVVVGELQDVDIDYQEEVSENR